MIFYFSATGNSKHVATELAKAADDEISYIPDLIGNSNMSFDVGDDNVLGFVTPTYYWGLPAIVEEFLKDSEFKFSKKPYTFIAVTYGTKNGSIVESAEKILSKKGIELDAKYEIKMPDSWTPAFDLTDDSIVSKFVETGDRKLETVKTQIINREKGKFQEDDRPDLVSRLFHQVYRRARMTEWLTAEDSCTGCGICADICPDKIVEIVDGKPEWNTEYCTMCLACLHRCPKFAIQYGGKTKLHGQYVNPHADM